MITHARVAPDGITLTGDLQYSVPIEYVDQAAPDIVLHTHTFVLPLDATTDSLITRAKEYGRTIRGALALLDTARQSVPAGVFTTVD